MSQQGQLTWWSSRRLGAYRVSPKSRRWGPVALSSRNRVLTASKLPSQYSTGLVGASGDTHRKCVYSVSSPCPLLLVSASSFPVDPLLSGSPASLHVKIRNPISRAFRIICIHLSSAMRLAAANKKQGLKSWFKKVSDWDLCFVLG